MLCLEDDATRLGLRRRHPAPKALLLVNIKRGNEVKSVLHTIALLCPSASANAAMPCESIFPRLASALHRYTLCCPWLGIGNLRVWGTDPDHKNALGKVSADKEFFELKFLFKSKPVRSFLSVLLVSLHREQCQNPPLPPRPKGSCLPTSMPCSVSNIT